MTTSKCFHLKCVRMVFLDNSTFFFLISFRVCLRRNRQTIDNGLGFHSINPFFIISNLHCWGFLRLLMLLKLVFWIPPTPHYKTVEISFVVITRLPPCQCHSQVPLPPTPVFSLFWLLLTDICRLNWLQICKYVLVNTSKRRLSCWPR